MMKSALSPYDIRCCFMKETNLVRRSLRCWAYEGRCSHRPNKGVHSRLVTLDEVEFTQHNGEIPNYEIATENASWPSECLCGYSFNSPKTQRKVLAQRIYEDEDGNHLTMDEFPLGAMWYVHNLVDGSKHWHERGGGPHLFVKTPGGNWDIDNVCKENDGWRRSGEPPLITVSPSINFRGIYHAVLKDGILESCSF